MYNEKVVINKYKGIRTLFRRGSVFRNIYFRFQRIRIRRNARILFQEEPLFNQVEIETINRCNGVCSFCPVNKTEIQRPYAKMSEPLFEKIINELGKLEYKGYLSLHSNNEPFIDTRMIQFCKYARGKLPKAYIQIYTNGSLLDENKLSSCMEYLDKLVIDNYDDNLELSSQSKMALNLYSQHPEWNGKLEIYLRKINEVLFTRGGQSPNNQKKVVFNMPCILPMKQMIIRPDGKISLCCNDALGKYTLGDVNDLSLMEIWHSEKFRRIRESLLINRTNSMKLCRYCDTFSS